MDVLCESEFDIHSKNARRTSSEMIVSKKKCKYVKDIGFNETTNPELDSPSDNVAANCIPPSHPLESQNSIQELPTSDQETTNFPQDSSELVIRHAIDRDEANRTESPNRNSITGTSSTPESFDCNTTLDSKRTRRTSKRKKGIDECCPVCGITVRVPELDSHFSQEVKKLSDISRRFKKTTKNDNGISTSFVQVKSNRQNRLTAKVSLYAAKSREIQCPVCKVQLSGTVEENNNHVLCCLQTDDDVNVEDEDSSFEEYEIGDETRIRAISLVPGGYRSLQGRTVNQTQEDDLHVDVDIDDTMTYGQPQYTELDVISFHSQDDEAHEQLRKAVLMDPNAQPKVLESRKWSENTGVEEKEVAQWRVNKLELKQEKTDDSEIDDKKNVASSQIISALKEMIKQLEDQKDDVKCLICLEPYTKPVVSVTCWHVHCEECWLKTMGVKKLCPQCNMIVFPGDLRKIYL